MLATLLAAWVLGLVPGDPFTRAELPGGTRLLVLHLPEAPRQSLFAFLPEGLLRDGAGQAQFAHLLEHALIRGVEPEGLQAGGMLFNGETTAAALRLEVFSAPEQWQAGVERIARFLAVRSIEPELLAREKASIESELASTLATGHTHKWAQAAWTQVVLHGRELASVRGDVAQATPEAVAACAAQRALLGGGAFLVAVGPTPPAELEAHLRKQLEGLPTIATRAKVGTKDPAAFGQREARWDLAAGHYLEWYVLPGKSEEERAAAWVLGHRASMAVMSSSDRLLSGGRCLASVQPLDAERMLLLVQAPLEKEADPKALQAAIGKALERGCKAKLLQSDARSASTSLGQLPDFAALRASVGARPGADLIEAQSALNLAQHELASGLPLPLLMQLCAQLEGAELESSARKHLAAERRASLVLRAPE